MREASNEQCVSLAPFSIGAKVARACAHKNASVTKAPARSKLGAASGEMLCEKREHFVWPVFGLVWERANRARRL